MFLTDSVDRFFQGNVFLSCRCGKLSRSFVSTYCSFPGKFLFCFTICNPTLLHMNGFHEYTSTFSPIHFSSIVTKPYYICTYFNTSESVFRTILKQWWWSSLLKQCSWRGSNLQPFGYKSSNTRTVYLLWYMTRWASERLNVNLQCNNRHNCKCFNSHVFNKILQNTSRSFVYHNSIYRLCWYRGCFISCWPGRGG